MSLLFFWLFVLICYTPKLCVSLTLHIQLPLRSLRKMVERAGLLALRKSIQTCLCLVRRVVFSPDFQKKTNIDTFWAEIASPPDGVIGNKENMNVDDMQDLSGESGSRGQGGDEALVSAAASGSYRPKKRKKAKHRFPLDPHFIGFENKDLRTCFAIVVVQLVLAIPEVRHFS